MNRGSSSLCQIFLHLSFPFVKINYFFSREKSKRYYSRLFPDWAARLQKVTKNRYEFSILQKVKFPLPKYLFCKTRKFDLLYLLLKVLQRTPVMRLLWRRYFFFYEVQHFVVKQRIRNCLWKCASRSLFENGMPLASFKYALKKRFLLFQIDFVDCVFCCKIQSRTKTENQQYQRRCKHHNWVTYFAMWWRKKRKVVDVRNGDWSGGAIA